MKNTALALTVTVALAFGSQASVAKSKKSSVSTTEATLPCKRPTRCDLGTSNSVGKIQAELESARLGSGHPHLDITDDILQISDMNLVGKIKDCSAKTVEYILCRNATPKHDEALFEEYRWANRVFGTASYLISHPESRAEMIALENSRRNRAGGDRTLTSGEAGAAQGSR